MKNKQTIKQHFGELRKRILLMLCFFILCFALAYYFSEIIYNFLLNPLLDIYQHREGGRLIYTGLTEAFLTYLKLALYVALFVTFPFILIQFYLFLSPGLYKKEKKFLLLIFIVSPILFVAGAFLVYQYIFPLAWQFFISFEQSNNDIPIILEARISEYLSLSLQLIIAFGLAFQMPVLMCVLVKAGLLSVKTLEKHRRIVIVLIVIFAAIITPPDIISQIGLALPIYLLFEVSIFLLRRSEQS